MKIQKTISLRVIRPLYPPDIEAEIKTEKVRRKENGGTGSLESLYFKNLENKYSTMVSRDEFCWLLSEMQRNITSIYNRTISQLYQRLIVDKESISTAKALSEGPYRDFKSTFNSYIALGLRQKIQSNFRKKDLMAFKIALPTAKSDKFPIPIYMQTNFKIKESDNSDFVIDLPLMEYITKETKGKNKTFHNVEILKPPKVKNIPVILSTLRRKESGQWFSDEGTNAEIRRIITGEYKVSWIEIVRRTRFGKHYDWFVNMVISYEKSHEGLDTKVTGGIDIGVSSPLVCAVSNSLARYVVSKNDIMAFSKRAEGRRRGLLRKNRLKRSGHGSKNKLEPITVLTEKNERFKKSIMQRWAKEVAEFYKKNRTAVVYMEELSGIKNRDDFFSKVLRMYWNYSQLQNIIENKLKEYGIEVKYISPKDTSRKCHSCGHINDHFTFEFRQKNDFPLFKCSACVIECSADYNAARNIAITN
jgi:IS605 OrfB family transposase